MQINKITYKKKRVKIEFDQKMDSPQNGVTFNCANTRKTDAPLTEDFLKALIALREDVYQFVPIRASAVKDLVVHTVTIKREKEALAVIYSCTMTTELTQAPFNFNTPKVNENEDAWTDDVSDHVLEVMDQAEKYLNGEFGQVDLFEEGEEETQEQGMQLVSNEEEAVAA